MTAHELLRRMPEFLDHDAAAGIDATIQYEVSTPLHHVLADGTLTTYEGRAAAPDLVVRMKDEDLVSLFRGELNPMMAFMTGRVAVQGDTTLARRLVGLVDRERLADLT